MCVMTCALSEERRRQNAHRPSVAPHADRCAVAPHGADILRRLEARHGSCCRTVLHVLLLVPHLVDPKRVAAGRNDVPVRRVLTRKTLHQGELVAHELADLPAGRYVPKAHRLVAAGTDDLRTVAAESYLGHDVRVPRQRAHLWNSNHP